MFARLLCLICLILFTTGPLTRAASPGRPVEPNGANSTSRMTAQNLPDPIPPEWLAPENHPRFLVTPEKLEVAAGFLPKTAHGRRYIAAQKERAARFVAMDDADLRALVPPPGCLITYGLGMNLDPVRGEPLEWAGWEDPFRVRDSAGRLYPNAEWPDSGSGIEDPGSGERYFFRALAHGRIFQELELRVLPALADVAALTGSAEHARAAALLLDAIAEVYPTNRRGPMDYPTQEKDMDRGGRLDRPYYQVARGLYNYARIIDLIAPSGALENPSIADGLSIREHVIRNLLWDGGAYCYEFAREGYALHNGHADYLRGAAIVGVMLGVRELAEPLVSGPASFFRMFDNNVDRNGFYYETAPMYAMHTRSLYFTMAELAESMRRLGWTDVPSAYEQPAFRQFLSAPFNRREVGGHVPLIGDNGPDRYEHAPDLRRPARGASPLIRQQIQEKWIQLVQGIEADRVARALRRDLGEDFEPPSQPWFLYNLDPQHIERVAAAEPEDFIDTGSTVYGAKGLALLRGGKGSLRHGAQLFFGPINNHGQREALTWTFFARGAEWSYDPGYFNTHYRMGWTSQSVAHQAMVVDQTSYDISDGGGYLASWADAPDVQFAHAIHSDAYQSHGVTRYERLIGQVPDPETGELGYWIDIGRVAGGRVRDDSFHTQHQVVEVNLPLAPTGYPGLHGDASFGEKIRKDYRLEGFDQEDFYWMPPGDGYGFLGRPRQAEQTEVVRAHFTKPAFAAGAILIADLSGAPGRQLILADGPDAPKSPRVPHLLRRDQGDGPSVFAKLLRLTDTLEDDPILSFSEIHLESSDITTLSPLANAWKITWKNGRTDLWIYSGDGPVSLPGEGVLPRITTDAAVVFIQFDATGTCQRIETSGGNFAKVGSKRHAAGFAGAVATVREIDWKRKDFLRLKVEWQEESAPPNMPVSSLVIANPSSGQLSSWSARSAENGALVFDDRHSILARTELTATEDGWYRLGSSVSRFTTAFSEAGKRYAVGKAVYWDDEYIGRIVALSDDSRAIRLEPAIGQLVPPAAFPAVISELGPGDQLTIPARLSWRRVP